MNAAEKKTGDRRATARREAKTKRKRKTTTKATPRKAKRTSAPARRSKRALPAGGGGAARRTKDWRLTERVKRQLLELCFGQLPRAKSTRMRSGPAVVLAAAEPGSRAWTRRLSSASLAASGSEEDSLALARRVRRLSSPAKRARLAPLLEAAGSPHRLAILAKLLEGPATYQALQKATKLKVGPLYHHISQLRLASLVAPKERDLYRLTHAGRNLLLVLLAALPLLSDTRPVEEV